MAEADARFLALGDSYTIGEGVAPEERWPVRLAAALRAAGVAAGEPELIARTGWTTDELEAAIGERAPGGPYDLVSLLVGVNNQYRGRGVEEYRGQLRRLLGRAVPLAGGRPQRVLVVSIPDWGVTPFAEGRDRRRIAAEIDAFNAVARSEAATAGCRFIDVTAVSRRAPSEPALLAGDGLHPSGAMYREWVEVLLPEALAAIGTIPVR